LWRPCVASGQQSCILGFMRYPRLKAVSTLRCAKSLSYQVSPLLTIATADGILGFLRNGYQLFESFLWTALTSSGIVGVGDSIDSHPLSTMPNTSFFISTNLHTQNEQNTNAPPPRARTETYVTAILESPLYGSPRIHGEQTRSVRPIRYRQTE